MALSIKDGAGSTQNLKTGTDGGELVPFHAISGTVSVTASQAAPVYVTGTISIPNTVSVTASQANPVSVSMNSLPVDFYAYSGGVYGALISKITQSVGEVFAVTSSKNQPLFVVSDSDEPVVVANSANIPLFITSSNTYPVVTKQQAASSASRNKFSSFASTINWAGTGSSDISGTFIIASDSSTRKGLMFANNTSYNLYVAIGDTDVGATNGFLLSTTASAPAIYSFILYPSGTYIAEREFVNIKHSGFFVSSSNIDVSLNVYVTE